MRGLFAAICVSFVLAAGGAFAQQTSEATGASPTRKARQDCCRELGGFRYDASTNTCFYMPNTVGTAGWEQTFDMHVNLCVSNKLAAQKRNAPQTQASTAPPTHAPSAVRQQAAAAPTQSADARNAAERCQKANSDNAIAACEQAIRLNPSDAWLWVHRGRGWASRGDYDRASADYSEAIRLNPRNAIAYNNRGVNWSNKGDHDRAIVDFSEAVRLDPKLARAYLNRSNSWAAKDEYSIAIADNSEAIRLDPKSAAAFISRGHLWSLKGDHDRAIADYSEAIRLDPKSATAYFSRGVRWAHQGDRNRGMADYNEAIRLDPKYVLAYAARGDARYFANDIDGAIADYNEAIKLDPKHEQSHLGRGRAWYSKNDFDRAIADLKEAIKLNGGNQLAKDILNLALAAKAAAAPRLTANVAPNQPSTQSRVPNAPASAIQQNLFASNENTSIVLRCHNERGQNAITACDEAIRVNPVDIASYNNRGVAHKEVGNHDQAIRDFTVAVGLDPNFGRAHFNRARAYETKGDFVSALSDMRDYVRKGDSTPNRVESEGIPALQRLEKIVAALSNTTAQPPILQQTLVNGMPSLTIPDQGRRVALIIGNARYQHAARLENPTNDADLLASSLRSVGFQSVTVKKDLTREDTLRALREFREIADAADWAVVHYAGHGIEFGGVNYLVPIEARLRSDRDIELEAITVSSVVSAIEGARKLRLVVLDACRDNPFAGQMRRTTASRSLGRGLAQMEPQAGTLIAYAAKAGEVADDGAGSKNSPFAAALAKRLQQSPPLEVRRLFDFVRDDVMEMTRNKQQPFTYGSLTARENYFFATR